MQISLIFVLVIVALTNAANNNTSEPSLGNNPKIVNGLLVSIEEVPYQVSVRIHCYDEIIKGLGHNCGGSLISQRLVFTATHCFFSPGPDNIALKLSKSSILVVMGNTYLDRNSSYESSYRVADVKIHSNYNASTFENDIALIFIDGVVKLSSTVQLIELNTFPIKSGTMCQASGWGITESGHVSNELRRLEVPIHNPSVCLSKNLDFNKQLQVCAGNMNSSNGVCKGDSGGPLVCNGVLVGITSYVVNGCAQNNTPDFYTNVAFFYDWIKAQNKTFNKKLRAKSMADSLVSFDRCCYIFVLLAVLLYEPVY